MVNTQTSQRQRRLSVTLFYDHPPDDFGEASQAHSLPQAMASTPFPLSNITLDDHPRDSVWAGLAEAGQILAEAEIHKGAPLTLAELRTLMETHLDAYEPRWSFGWRGIGEVWLSGFSHAFAFYAQQAVRIQNAEPLHGIGLVGQMGGSRPAEGDTLAQPTEPLSPSTVRFREATITVSDPEAFWQGVWEGQLAALEQRVWAGCQSLTRGATIGPVSSAWCFDELTDLCYEAGNHGLDFIAGYMLGLSEGLLCGRLIPPAKVQVEELLT